MLNFRKCFDLWYGDKFLQNSAIFDSSHCIAVVSWFNLNVAMQNVHQSNHFWSFENKLLQHYLHSPISLWIFAQILHITIDASAFARHHEKLKLNFINKYNDNVELLSSEVVWIILIIDIKFVEIVWSSKVHLCLFNLHQNHWKFRDSKNHPIIKLKFRDCSGMEFLESILCRKWILYLDLHKYYFLPSHFVAGAILWDWILVEYLQVDLPVSVSIKYSDSR